MGVWPVGYFRAISSWLLRNRRSISSRIDVISAEMERIGLVTVTYLMVEQDGSSKATEQRIGFSVTKGSSLGRLVRAYVAKGGNPLDISSFLRPDSTEIVADDGEGNLTIIQTSPHGGVIAPMSAEYNEPQAIQGKDTGYGGYPGGYIRADGYFPARQGGRADRGGFDSNSVVRYMHQIRSWANQDIKERLLNLEWQIIKLSDLYEQLEKERDVVLQQAFGGALTGLQDFDRDRFDPDQRVQILIQDMYELLFETDAGGKVTSYVANEDKVPFLKFTFPDVPSENRDPMG